MKEGRKEGRKGENKKKKPPPHAFLSPSSFLYLSVHLFISNSTVSNTQYLIVYGYILKKKKKKERKGTPPPETESRDIALGEARGEG